MSVKKNTNALTVVDELPRKSMLDLVKEKREFIKWVHENIKSASMRKMALEHASYYYLNVRYDMALDMLRSKIEKVYSYKMRLTELCHKHRINVLADYQKLKSAIMEATKEKTKMLNVPDGTLLPAELQEERLNAIRLEEIGELKQLRLQQKKRRSMHRAMTAEAAERAKLRAEFITQMKQEIDDPEVLAEAIDEYDRILNQSQFLDE